MNNDDDPMDDNGHGTHCAGIIAASDDGGGVIGTAPEVNILAYKVLDGTGSSSYSDVIAAIQKAVDDGAEILSMSLGSNPKAGDPAGLEEACNNAYDAGMLLVAAAGNDGTWLGRGDNVYYPARYDSVIAVAATTSSDVPAFFSGTGPAVELAAPGDHILSTYPGGYATMSGTSMACPHVSGTAALVKSANGSLSNSEIREILQQSALELGKTGRDALYGYGLVQADAAVEKAGGSENPPGGSDPEPEFHIGDLDGYATARGVKWQAVVTVTAHDSSERGLSGAQVTGIWDIGKTVSGMTGSDGTVEFSSGQMKTGESVTFTVTGASHDVYTYNTTANDVATTITISTLNPFLNLPIGFRTVFMPSPPIL
ncbi:MAG: S8 family serine peptidase [Methanomicrobiaceae archaeon]|nr:S8 family serine peptidase [Methanomicrobiaceae archaeon]